MDEQRGLAVARLVAARWWCAPMVEASDMAFRRLTRALGCGVASTPMIRARPFVRSPGYRSQWLLPGCPADEPRPNDRQTLSVPSAVAPPLRVHFEKPDRPLVVQLAGDDPMELAEACRIVAGRCDAVELNLGCPQSCARNGHYGAWLMDDLSLVDRIVRAMREAVPGLALLCKIRVFSGYPATLKYCQMLEQAGVDLITVHGRTREEKRSSACLARWEYIRRLKADLAVPVVANGNIRRMADARACLESTAADGVMSASALLRNPALFSGARYSRLQLAAAYLHFADRFPPPPVNVALHLQQILKGPLLRELRLEPLLQQLHRKQRTLALDRLQTELCEALTKASLDPSLPGTMHESEYFPQLEFDKDEASDRGLAFKQQLQSLRSTLEAENRRIDGTGFITAEFAEAMGNYTDELQNA